MPGRRAVAVLAAALTLTTACANTDGGGSTSDASGPIGGTITVFAAASLTGPFTRLGEDFEAANDGTTVTFSFAASSALANQLTQGAPADVFASAAPKNMKTVTGAGEADGDPTVFVRNQLVVAVPRGNPKGIKSLADLAVPGVKVALCAEQVPCGAAAKAVIAKAGVTVEPVTLEPDVKSTLSKVTLGEVDAALVYRTDAKAATSTVDGIEFPESAAAINDYPIVVLRNAPNKDTARAFVEYVLSEKGKTVLTRAGFLAP